ncbi:DUF4185 domain-containing protein [Pendulispora albinea]|uniref:DUF4185 domain-containing protein n=1 Tax=Pendulispora albinea TaxID=2741071 RepID=A0ABZ2M6Z4_9BACT
MKDPVNWISNPRSGRLGGIAVSVLLGGAALVSCTTERTVEESVSADALNLPAIVKKRVTGADLDTARRWEVAGTDLGIPYRLENGSIGYLFGDTFRTPFPSSPGDTAWRSPVMLRSNDDPWAPDGIRFDSAAKVWGDGRAPEVVFNAHDTSRALGAEFTVIPNDGVSLPDNRQIISYMSINTWYDNEHPGPPGQGWKTNYAGLAFSDNGNDFVRTGTHWENNGANDDPFQMQTFARDGDWIYVFSVRAGRQFGPMMLQKVHWTQILDRDAYIGWGYDFDRKTWAWGRPCTPILEGRFGEPSVRRLDDRTWAMAYLNVDFPGGPSIVTRTATGPDKPWSGESLQVHWSQEPYLYGGFIHPRSRAGFGNLHIMVSKWTTDRYDVTQWVGSL